MGQPTVGNWKLLIRNLRTGNIPKHSIFNLLKEQSMTKQELIDSITEAMKIRYDRAVSKADVSAFLDSLSDVATVSLKAGEDVMLPGLGKLVVKEKAARAGRNPQTGETIQIAAKRVAAFSPTKALKDALE